MKLSKDQAAHQTIVIKNYLDAVESRAKCEIALHKAKAAALEKSAKVVDAESVEEHARQFVSAEHVALEIARAKEIVAGVQFYRISQEPLR
jgi:hypothetical protein